MSGRLAPRLHSAWCMALLYIFTGGLTAQVGSLGLQQGPGIMTKACFDEQ